MNIEALFQPFQIKTMRVPSRFVMTPMVRPFSPGGVPDQSFAPYYRRRAEGGCGLILSGGASIDHPVSESLNKCANFHGDEPMAGWKKIVAEVHAGGARFIPQLEHVGMMRVPAPYDDVDPVLIPPNPERRPIGPSGLYLPVCFPGEPIPEPRRAVEPMTQHDIDEVIEAFGKSADAAKTIGSDGVEIHGGHGFLLDQFLWKLTNVRSDHYGGSVQNRVRFAVEVVREVRHRIGNEFPLFFRFSQWKQQDYAARIAETPEELAEILEPLADAGVDLFDCSTRRFWEPAFEGSELTLAGWAKKVTGKPTMAVGSLGLEKSAAEPSAREQRETLNALLHEQKAHRMTDDVQLGGVPAQLDEAVALFERGEFDLLGVGRMALVNPSWPNLVRRGAFDQLKPFHHTALLSLE